GAGQLQVLRPRLRRCALLAHADHPAGGCADLRERHRLHETHRREGGAGMRPRRADAPASLRPAGRGGARPAAPPFFPVPHFWKVTWSLKSDLDVGAYPPVWWFTPSLHSYAQLFLDMGALQALINSTVIVGIATSLAMVAGTLAAYALARFDIKGKNVIAF